MAKVNCYVYKGKEYTLDELLKKAKMNKSTFYTRINNLKMSVEDAIDTPLGIGVKRYDYKGKLYTIRELSKLSGLADFVIRSRISQGWSVEKAVDTPKRKKKKVDIKKKCRGYAKIKTYGYKPTEENIRDNQSLVKKSLDEIYKSSLLKRPVS